MIKKNPFMIRAIELSIESAETKGGPFGSVIVKNNKIVAEGSNKVTMNNDPTAVSYTHLTLPTKRIV